MSSSIVPSLLGHSRLAPRRLSGLAVQALQIAGHLRNGDATAALGSKHAVQLGDDQGGVIVTAQVCIGVQVLLNVCADCLLAAVLWLCHCLSPSLGHSMLARCLLNQSMLPRRRAGGPAARST